MRERIPPPHGRVRVHHVSEPTYVELVRQMVRKRHPDPANYRPRNWTLLTDWLDNDILYEWGAVIGNLLLRKGQNYGVGGMYIEFENVANPGDPVAAPAVSRGPDEGIAYYNGLATNPTRDYLRVPLIAGILNSTDQNNYPHGNAPTFFAQTSGVQGVHGKPFSDANNSKVFGGALVAFVDDTDFTRDLVMSRFYLAPADQQVKLPTSQVGLEWQQTYE